jgi:alpha-glucuronidase
MTYIALLNLLLSLASSVAKYVSDKQLMEAGSAQEISRNLEASLNVMEKARKARDSAVADFDKRGGVPDDKDPNLRD